MSSAPDPWININSITKNAHSVKPCVKCRHVKISLEKGDKEPRIQCGLFIDSIDPVIGKTNYKSAKYMRTHRHDTCSTEGKFFKLRTNEFEDAQFNATWVAAWLLCVAFNSNNSEK